MSDEIVKGVTKLVDVSYEDALQPVAKEMGEALQTVGQALNRILRPLSAVIWGYDQMEGWLKEKVAPKLTHVPESELLTPDATIAVPALEAMRYCGNNEEIADLFAQLLATSMQKSKAGQAHPSFVTIIKSLSSDEAKILHLLKNRGSWPAVDVRAKLSAEAQKQISNSKQKEGFKNTSFTECFKNISLIGIEAECEYPDNTPIYIGNLDRLGIIEFASDHLLLTSQYTELETSNMVLTAKQEASKDGIMEAFLKRKKFDLTDFGASLVLACCYNENITKRIEEV